MLRCANLVPGVGYPHNGGDDRGRPHVPQRDRVRQCCCFAAFSGLIESGCSPDSDLAQAAWPAVWPDRRFGKKDGRRLRSSAPSASWKAESLADDRNFGCSKVKPSPPSGWVVAGVVEKSRQGYKASGRKKNQGVFLTESLVG